MIITRTPFRVTLGGGGTDLPSFYQEHGGFILAVAIDKYMFLNVNTPIVDDKIRVRYTSSELVDHVDEVQHTLAREALRHFGVTSGIEIVSIADIPAGTGVGSSSSYLVGLLNAMHALLQDQATPQKLAEEACYIELEVLKKPIGKQDQYIAAYGGVTCFNFNQDGSVEAVPLKISMETLFELEDNLLLFFTGYSRSAGSILGDQHIRTGQADQEMLNNLHYVKELGHRSQQALEAGKTGMLGELMHEHWELKRGRSPGMANERIDRLYEIARGNGAIGVRSGREAISCVAAHTFALLSKPRGPGEVAAAGADGYD